MSWNAQARSVVGESTHPFAVAVGARSGMLTALRAAPTVAVDLLYLVRLQRGW